jgi:hypothetical protein
MADMPRLNPREAIVRRASLDLATIVADWSSRNPDLTAAEFLKVLLSVSHDQAQTLLKNAIREERHGDQDKPGGIE